MTPRQWIAVVDDISRSPTMVLVDVVESVSAGLVGRTLTIETADDTIDLELVSVTCSHDNPPVAMGALRPGRDIEGIESVVVTASDVAWSRGRLDHLEVEAHHVRLETGIVARLTSAPVEMVGRVGQATVDAWVDQLRADTGAPVQRVELFAADALRVHLRSWLTAEVGVELVDDEIGFPVRRLRAHGITVPFVHRRLSTRRVTVPPLAQGLRVTSITVTEDAIEATGRIERVREPVWLDQVFRAASTVGTQAVLRLRPPEGATR